MTTNISRVEIFCEDKHVGTIQRMLAGVGVLSVTSHPVTNAKLQGGKIVAGSSGNAMEMFTAWAKQKKLKAVTNADVREFMKYAGRSESSFGNFVVRAVQKGVLKAAPKNGPKRNKTYAIV